MKKEQKVFISGDFKAQIGQDDLTKENKELIGRQLYHKKCNSNSEELKNLAQLFRTRIENSFSESQMVLTTCADKNSRPQIDHILSNWRNSPIRTNRIKGTISY